MAVGQVGFKDQRKVRVSTEPCITTTPPPCPQTHILHRSRGCSSRSARTPSSTA
jgi:hypothetical protein